MPAMGGPKSQSLQDWARQLSADLSRPGGADVGSMVRGLTGMADDASLPAEVRDAAAIECASMHRGLSSTPLMTRFLDIVQQQIDASGDLQHLPPTRNFGASNPQAPQAVNAEPFIRAIQTELMQFVGLNAPTAQPQPQPRSQRQMELANRPPVNAAMPASVLKMARQIVENPGKSAMEHAKDVVESEARSNQDSAREIVKRGRGEVAFGLTQEKLRLFTTALQDAMSQSNSQAFSNTMIAYMRGQPYNFRVAPALFDAGKLHLHNGGPQAGINIPALVNLVPEPERRFVAALTKQPTPDVPVYATLGAVSPTGPAPNIAQAFAAAGPMLVAAQWAQPADMQQFLQTPLPLPQPESAESAAKRLRTQGGFGQVASNAGETAAQAIDLEALQPFAYPMISLVSPTMPDNPATPATRETASPEANVVAQAIANAQPSVSTTQQLAPSP
ncbi:hypothetical protein ACSFA3_09610 [Variovorax sp. RHLX14]|uniref:hypothetical protein n=1 Tax=Variovorax sp. RHLX14 TaxID=1259731 RepID=UPI003F45D92E